MPCSPPLFQSVRHYVRHLFPTRRSASVTSRKGQTAPAANESAKEQANPAAPGEPIEYDSTPRFLVCNSCWETGLFAQALFQDAWTSQRASYTGFSHATTWDKLQTSSKSGCQWCSLVLSTRTPAIQQDAVQVAVQFRVSSGTNGETPKGVQIMVLGINGVPHSSYYVYTKRDDPSASSIVARDKLIQVNSPEARAMAQECILQCVRKHGRCLAPHDTALPTRVVDCSDPRNPKLHLSSGEKAPYVALSYVWGETQSNRLTTANVDAYLRRIDPNLLPRTIQDAIETTHSFGLQYLWVDALCILQDDRDDRAHEIAQMRSIFRQAYFTIIAASAQKASDGFLHDRPATTPHDVTLPFRCADGNVGTMFLSPIWRQYDGSTEPVNQRAWCLEERLLSPRALVYASHTLQFHCQTAVVNVGDAVCGPIAGQRLPDLLLRADSEIPTVFIPSDHRSLRWAWVDVVGDYTQRATTKPGDKLVALAAVAELFQRAWNSDYLAGLWRASLLRDLLWYKSLETRFARPTRYRAPSWSWAAVDGHVLAGSADDRLDPDVDATRRCEVLACEVVPATPLLPLGKVVSGTLRLRAVLLEATWNPDSPTPDLFMPEGATPTVTPGHPESPTSSLYTTEPIHIGCAYPDSLEDASEIWAVPVLWNESAQYAAGLIVASMGDEEGVFRRVGYFHSPEDSPGGLSWMLGHEPQEMTIV
ncbi:HET-domain-containing protein [Trametes elegans]|nr:HET-domain-containing protein [Trametes elegans]